MKHFMKRESKGTMEGNEGEDTTQHDEGEDRERLQVPV